MKNLPDDDALTVVVDPDDFECDALLSLRGVVWLWFLQPLHQESSTLVSVAPRLARGTEESLMRRRSFLEEVLANGGFSVVVSDAESYEYCARQGYHVFLSPPPVSDSVSAPSASAEKKFAVLRPREQTEYLRKYLDALPTKPALVDVGSLLEIESPQIPSHWIVLRDSLTKCFPYGAAIAAVAGQTLISEALHPHWGLEPGLDYVEYSTPEELRRIVEQIARHPHSTQLVAWRAGAKRDNFVASKIFLRLVTGVPQNYWPHNQHPNPPIIT